LAEIPIINKGLGFVPSHFKSKYQNINKDMLRFERKLQLHYYFKSKENKEDSSSNTLPHNIMLEGTSNWWPKKLNGHITKFCHDVKTSIFDSLNKCKIQPNVTKTEIKALSAPKANS